jgi:hypothetical protein
VRKEDSSIDGLKLNSLTTEKKSNQQPKPPRKSRPNDRPAQ